jgi:hypothetical protein
VPADDEAFAGLPVYVGAMKNVEAGETTFRTLPLIPGDAAYMFVLML